MTTSVFDVAQYILEKEGEMTAMKLQKLVYYSQAWSLVWDGETLFDSKIEAWSNGPIVPALYQAHRKKFKVSTSTFSNRGESSNLSDTQKETVDAVLSTYALKSPRWLSELTHHEQPWINARKGLNRGDRGNQEISLESMAEYYDSL